ncbi:MAG: hypothetical protein K6G63_03090 [Eubacterium sp.]|nr:hypothetical protein [Eubacterium sp.]
MINLEKYSGKKCEFNYINKQKKFHAIVLVLFVVFALLVFFAGLMITHTRANIYTVISILMVLPAAKRVVSLVVMVPNKSVSKDRAEHLSALLGSEDVLLLDYVFSSRDKLLSLDYVVVSGKQIMGVKSQRGCDEAYMKQYLSETVSKISDSYSVKIFENDEKFENFYQKATGREAEADQEKVVEQLKILAV